MPTFGDMLRERRKELRLGLREFAQRAGMDSGNLSKMERGRLAAPQAEEILNRICAALEWRRGSAGAEALHDQAAVDNGQIPKDLLDDAQMMAKVPLLLRTVHNKQLKAKEIERLIEMIREA